MENFKRYFHSSVITFLTSFSIAFGILLEEALKSGAITETVLKACFWGGLLAGSRAVTKILYEKVVPKK